MDEGSVAGGRVCLMSEMPRARRGGEGRAVGNLVKPRLPATFQLTNTSGLIVDSPERRPCMSWTRVHPEMQIIRRDVRALSTFAECPRTVDTGAGPPFDDSHHEVPRRHYFRARDVVKTL
ncbi:unnamed protein product [Arctogadus glacialis]